MCPESKSSEEGQSSTSGQGGSGGKRNSGKSGNGQINTGASGQSGEPTAIPLPPDHQCLKNPSFAVLRANEHARHNELRKKHRGPALKQTLVLYNLIQGYMNTWKNRKTLPNHNENRHIRNPPRDVKDRRGENLFYSCWSSGVTYTYAEATQSWYDEYPRYNFNSGKGSGVYLHFTQLVWIETKEVAYAHVFDSDCECIYVGANYYPTGNWGSFKDNVKAA
jgi:superfamily I DNA/RNA helicase